MIEDKPQIIGVISAYIPNRQLPGLLKGQGLTAAYDHIQKIQSFDEAKTKETESQQSESVQDTEPPQSKIDSVPPEST